MLKPTILSISLATVMAGAAVSPALSLISKAFPGNSPTLIKLILTAPSLMIIPFSFLSSFLTQKMTKRTILIIGLVIYVIGGAGGQFAPSINILLVFRFLLGVGIGLVMPISMSLINDYYSGKERIKMMGYNSAFSNFGGILTMMAAGFLAGYGWRIPFNVYLLGLIIMLLVIIYLPDNKIRTVEKKKNKNRMPIAVYGFALAIGGIMIAYYSIATNMALFLEQSSLGSAPLAGTIISFTTIGGLITSLMLVHLESFLKNYIVPSMLFGMGVGFVLLSMTTSIPVILISVCLVGFGQGSLFPIIMLKAMDQVTPQQSDRAIAYTSSFTFLGQFLSPLFLDSMGRLFQTPNIRFQYAFIAIFLMAAVLILFINKYYQYKMAHKKEISKLGL